MKGFFFWAFCKANDVLIVNGRKIGDLFGSPTSFLWNGEGLVDYVIADYLTFSSIKNLWVGEFIPWLSDHCPLVYNIELSKQIVTPMENTTNSLKDCPNRLTWDETSK